MAYWHIDRKLRQRIGLRPIAFTDNMISGIATEVKVYSTRRFIEAITADIFDLLGWGLGARA